MSEFKLEFELRGDTEIVLRRKFRAPKALVFRCFTDAEILPRWLTCGVGQSIHCEVNTEIAGMWRHKIDMGENGIFDSFGQTLEFEPPNRYVRSDVFNVPVYREAISRETTTFTEEDGVTTVEAVIRHLSKEYRDGHAASGIDEGSAKCYEMLDALLPQLSL